MVKDPITGEVFLRVVGRRSPPAIGEVPSPEARAALIAMAQYRTCAPKGIFIYRSHEEMEADRLRWTVQAMVEAYSGGAGAPHPEPGGGADGDCAGSGEGPAAEEEAG